MEASFLEEAYGSLFSRQRPASHIRVPQASGERIRPAWQMHAPCGRVLLQYTSTVHAQGLAFRQMAVSTLPADTRAPADKLLIYSSDTTQPYLPVSL